MATGKEIGVLGGHERGPSVWSLAFSPDGRTLATAESETVRLWEVATAKEIGVLPRSSFVWSLAFSTDGGMLVGAQHHGIAKWDVVSGKHIADIAIADW